MINKSMKTGSDPVSLAHRDIHRSAVEEARRSRADGASHARLMASAAVARFYLQRLRAIDC